MGMQFHLTGRGFSGRGVRIRELGPDEVSDNLSDAAKLVGSAATIIELKKTEWRIGVKRMLTEYSEPCEDIASPDVKWRKVSPEMLAEWGKVFKSKDISFLESVYRDEYEVIPGEVEAIKGKAVPLSED